MYKNKYVYGLSRKVNNSSVENFKEMVLAGLFCDF